MSNDCLLQLPSELLKIKPLSVIIPLESEEVKQLRNTAKNVAKIEQKIFAVDKLKIILNDAKEATLYDEDNNKVSIKITKRRDQRRSVCPGLDTIEEEEEEEEEDDDAESDEFDAVESEESFNLDELFTELADIEVFTDDFSMINNNNVQDKMSVTPRESIEDENEVKAEFNSKMSQSTSLQSSPSSASVRSCNGSLSPQVVDKFPRNFSSSSDDHKLVLGSGLSKRTCRSTSPRPRVFERSSSNHDAQSACSSSTRKESYKVKKHSGRRESVKDWRVGDEVVACWSSDGVWRQGEIHEIRGSRVQVVATREVGVMSTFTMIRDLKPATIPVDLLNSVS